MFGIWGERMTVKGFAAKTAHVDLISFIGPTARVEGRAKIIVSDMFGLSKVSDDATVERSSLSVSAQVRGKAEVVNSGMIDEAQAADTCKVEHSELSGSAQVYGNGMVYYVDVTGSSRVFGDALLENNLPDSYDIVLDGDCKFGGHASFDGLYQPEDFVKKYGADSVIVVPDDKVVLTDVWDMG